MLCITEQYVPLRNICSCNILETVSHLMHTSTRQNCFSCINISWHKHQIYFFFSCLFFVFSIIFSLGFTEDLELLLKSIVHPVQHGVILGLYFSIAGCLRFMCDLSAPHSLFKHLLLGFTLFISFKKGAAPSHSSFRDPVLSLDQSIIHQK